MTTLFTILFDGVAYGMLLFVLACGLAVTLGLMNFVNLAHGAFAMAGGYVCAVLVNQAGWPFFAGLPLAFAASAIIGAVLERLLYRHLYTRSHLDQVLFTVGLVFMSVAAVDYIMGSSRVFIKIPEALEGQIDFFGVGIGRYRLMIIVICGLLTLALQLVLARTRFGSRLRAAVDDPRAASGLGINVPQVFAFTFAFGCGLAGLGVRSGERARQADRDQPQHQYPAGGCRSPPAGREAADRQEPGSVLMNRRLKLILAAALVTGIVAGGATAAYAFQGDAATQQRLRTAATELGIPAG